MWEELLDAGADAGLGSAGESVRIRFSFMRSDDDEYIPSH